MVVSPSSGDYASPHVPMVFVEPAAETPKPPPETRGGGGISTGLFVLLVVLLLGAAIAGTGGFYWLWQGAAADAKTAQSKLDLALKDIKTLTEQKAAATAELGKVQQSLVQYAEIERLKGLTQTERKKIDDLLKVPSKVDYWKYHKAVDQQDPPFKEPAEEALRKKLEVLQNLSKDIGLWTKPSAPATTRPGTISPSNP